LIDVAKNYHAIESATSHGLHAIDVVSGFEFSRAMEHVKSIIDGVYAHTVVQNLLMITRLRLAERN